jgi:hypothetical protein
LIVLSVRKGGWDPNEFSEELLRLNADGRTWHRADPSQFTAPIAAFFHGYNCGHAWPKDDALDSVRAIDSVWTQIGIRLGPGAERELNPSVVCCLWPGLGETWIEQIRFHKAIRNARQSAILYADFFSRIDVEFMLCGHSLGCGLIGWIADRLAQPAAASVWMGAAVPQYATAFVDPREQSDDLIAHVNGVDKHLFDFSRGLARNAGLLLNIHGNDPVLDGVFEASVREKACGRHGAWKGPERIPNVVDLDVTDAVHRHGDYRHLIDRVWMPIRDHARAA